MFSKKPNNCKYATSTVQSRAAALWALFFLLPNASLQGQPPETVKIEFSTAEEQGETVGEIVVQDAKGNLLLRTPDGRLRDLLSVEVVTREKSDTPMTALTQVQLFDSIKEDLPPGFAMVKKRHFVIIFNTSREYADWVGSLFERIYKGLHNYWRKKGIRLEEPRFPLVALVFKDKNSYQKYATRDVGKNMAENTIGYYNMMSNLMVSYDLTGVNGIPIPPGRLAQQMRANLFQPKVERTVATVVHEAVHQISFNCGLQTRMADNPRWLSEGLAMYFEAPDPKSRDGWSMGSVNRHNLQRYRQAMSQRLIPPGSLEETVASDKLIIENQRVGYPFAWALTYYLMKTKQKEFASYLIALKKLPPLGTTNPRDKVNMFKNHFGNDLAALEVSMHKWLRTVR
ncbi:MAG: DUF1570 domain-containing protein [Aureliella sp.]